MKTAAQAMGSSWTSQWQVRFQYHSSEPNLFPPCPPKLGASRAPPTPPLRCRHPMPPLQLTILLGALELFLSQLPNMEEIWSGFVFILYYFWGW